MDTFPTAATQAVRDFSEAAACGEEAYAIGPTAFEALDAQARERCELEPYLKPFARFEDGAGKDVLEIGVGLGADLPEGAAGQRHRGELLTIARALYPRPLLRALCATHGLYLLMEARK